MAVKAARFRAAFVQLHVLRGACGSLVTFLGAQLTRTLTVDETGKLRQASSSTLRCASFIGGQPNSLGGIFTVRQKPPFMRDQLMASVSDFNSKRGFMVRSEGGEDVSNFNNLPRWAKGEVHFPPIGAFQAQCQS